MKNRIITLLCIVCLFTGNEVCRAQVQEVISGVVRNESNEPCLLYTSDAADD